jgi:hypothetical protein
MLGVANIKFSPIYTYSYISFSSFFFLDILNQQCGYIDLKSLHTRSLSVSDNRLSSEAVGGNNSATYWLNSWN